MDRKILHRFQETMKTVKYKEIVLLCGSLAELPAFYFLQNVSDFDFMTHSTNMCAIPKGAPVPKNFQGEILEVETHGVPKGYTRLMRNSTKTYYRRASIYYIQNNHGPAIRVLTDWFKDLVEHQVSLLAGKLNLNDVFVDEVHSICCPSWPDEAEEWKIRSRDYGWPPSELINRIVQEGCHFVGKSHPSDPDDDSQWRFSFSKAELILIHSWTPTQKYIYHVLRLIKKKVVSICGGEEKTSLCTYYFKTLMFWACEQKPGKFWDEQKLEECLEELICTMIECLIDKQCFNYFVRSCNLLDHLDGEVTYEREIEMLLSFIECLGSFLQNVPKACPNCRVCANVPDKVLFQINMGSVRYRIFDHLDRGCSHRATIDDELFSLALDELLEGIFNNVKFIETREASSLLYSSYTSSSSYSAKAERFLKEATQGKEKVFTWWAYSSFDIISAIAASSEISASEIGTLSNAKVRSMGESEPVELEYVSNRIEFTTRSPSQNLLSISCRQCQSPSLLSGSAFPWNSGILKFWKQERGPTFLISSAFLGNFYYATKLDYVAAYDVTRTALSNGIHSGLQAYLFPVVFCPEISIIFDEGIQTVLGFVWLYQRLMKASRRKHYFQMPWTFLTCPELYLHYVHIQCLRKIGVDLTLIIPAIQGFVKHRQICRFNYFVGNHHNFLLAAVLYMEGIDIRNKS